MITQYEKDLIRHEVEKSILKSTTSNYMRFFNVNKSWKIMKKLGYRDVKYWDYIKILNSLYDNIMRHVFMNKWVCDIKGCFKMRVMQMDLEFYTKRGTAPCYLTIEFSNIRSKSYIYRLEYPKWFKWLTSTLRLPDYPVNNNPENNYRQRRMKKYKAKNE